MVPYTCILLVILAGFHTFTYETEFDIRLSGGPEPNVGRVEVYYSGYWGGVCDNYDWDYRNANVTCRMLGYSTGQRLDSTFYYGRLTDPVWMGGVNCNGTEDSLADCSFDGWGQVKDCHDPACVFCYNVTDTVFDIRVSGGPEPNIGRVEVYYSGYWGSVCGQYDWDARDATVTCRMLGYSTGQGIYRTLDYGRLTYPVWMGGVDCNGTKDSLADCSFDGWGRVEDCYYPACVFCYNVTGTEFSIRLSGGPEPNMGRVEVYYNGYWGSVCVHYDWDDKDANVTCRMLGYSTGHRIYPNTRYGGLTDPVWMTGVDCNGTEDSLADCSFDGWGQVGYCYYPANVFCYNVTETKFNIRLSGGPAPNVGRVEVFYSGYWGLICNNDEWDYRDANVTCRMLGYSTGYDIYHTSDYGKLTDPVWMKNVDCDGTEDSLADCSFDGWGRVGDCNHYPASVFCYNITGADIKIRLSGGPEPHIGRVDVFYSGYWGTICESNGWDYRDAYVTCRMLGYSTGHDTYKKSIYGHLIEPVWMSGVDCNGTEDSLADCSFDGWGRVGFCYNYPANAFCYNATAATDIEIRLIGGPEPNIGRVEVFYSGYWGTICYKDWDYRDANVTCRKLGYSTGQHIYQTSSYGLLRDPVWMAGVDCNGTEDNLADCSFDGWGRVEDCSIYPASVFCYNFTVDSAKDVRLVDGPNSYSGHVEVFYSGYWGGVCSNNFDDRDAAVVCRMLKYSDGQAILLKLSGPKQPIWMDNLGCHGTESSLADCSFDGWGNVGSCNYQAYVTCYNKPDVSTTTDAPTSTEPTTPISETPPTSVPASTPATRSDIECETNHISLHVPLDLLPSGQQVTWNDPSCVVADNGTHLVGSIGLGDCGAYVVFNTTHVTFENELVSHVGQRIDNSAVHNGIDFGSGSNSVIVVQCVYPRREQASTVFRPVQGHIRFFEKTIGHMQVHMRQARDATFTDTYPSQTEPRKVHINDELFVKLTADQGSPTQVAINVDRCLATPSPSPLDTNFQELTNNGCPAIPSVTIHSSPSSEVHLSFRAFQFSSNPGAPVYVHCEVYVCPLSVPQCVPGCTNNAVRSRRAAVGGMKSHLVSTGPFPVADDKEQGVIGGQSTALIAVTGLCACLAVVATVFGILAWKGRRRQTSKEVN